MRPLEGVTASTSFLKFEATTASQDVTMAEIVILIISALPSVVVVLRTPGAMGIDLHAVIQDMVT